MTFGVDAARDPDAVELCPLTLCVAQNHAWSQLMASSWDPTHTSRATRPVTGSWADVTQHRVTGKGEQATKGGRPAIPGPVFWGPVPVSCLQRRGQPWARDQNIRQAWSQGPSCPGGAVWPRQGPRASGSMWSGLTLCLASFPGCTRAWDQWSLCPLRGVREASGHFPGLP